MKQTRKKLRQALSLIVIACMVILLIPTTNAKAMTQGEAVVEEARKHLGKPYVWGATGPNSFDCSGLTQYSYRQALGIEIGRTTYQQIYSGEEVSRSELQPGDLVFTSANHVQIYAGNGMVIHAPHSGDVVKEVPLYSFWRARRIVQGVRNGWVNENGKVYLYLDDVKQTGWFYTDGAWHYLDPDDGGARKTGWVLSNEKWYYLDPDTGRLQKGWVTVDNNKYYLDPDDGGAMITGWFYIDGAWSYFNKSGEMETGLITLDDGVYFLGYDGRMQKGWVYTNSGWYFFDTDSGKKITGWFYTDSAWYYLDPSNDSQMKKGWLNLDGNSYFLDTDSGKMVTGWFYTDSSWYYFHDSGIMAKGWIDVGNDRYYLQDNGRMHKGWLNYQGKMYYLYESGAMARNTTIDGKHIDGDGVATDSGNGA